MCKEVATPLQLGVKLQFMSYEVSENWWKLVTAIHDEGAQ